MRLRMIAKKCTLATKTSLSIQSLTELDCVKVDFDCSNSRFFIPQGYPCNDFFDRKCPEKPGRKYSNTIKAVFRYAFKMGVDLSLLSPSPVGDDDENKSPNVGSNVDSITSIPR